MRKWVARSAVAALGAILLYALFALFADARATLAALVAFDGRALALGLALTLTAYVVRALRWRLFLHRMGVLEPAGREALGFAAGMAMGLAPGKSGQVVKAYYLRLATGLPYSVSVPATFAERICDAVSMLLLLILGLALAPRLDAVPTLLASAALLLVLVALRHPRAAERALRPVARWGWVARHREGIVRGHANLRAHLRPGVLAAPTALGLVGFLFETLALQVLAAGLGHALPFGVCALAIGLADLAAMLSLVPGGVGVAEGGLVVVLALHGLPLADATALTLLFRLCTLWLGLALGAGAAGVLELQARRRAGRQGARIAKPG